MTWLSAYLLTQMIEVPVYLVGGKKLPQLRRWLLAVGASSLTHPVVWFAFPWGTASWELCFVGAETFAVLLEGLLGKLVGLERPWLWALAANGASVLVGLLVQTL